MEFRFANNEDCGLIVSFIRQLAAYEKMSDQVDEWTTYRLTGDTLLEMAK